MSKQSTLQICKTCGFQWKDTEKHNYCAHHTRNAKRRTWKARAEKAEHNNKILKEALEDLGKYKAEYLKQLEHNNRILMDGLQSIADSTCCEKCNEAKLVAQEKLKELV